jgi:hypothetical protein
MKGEEFIENQNGSRLIIDYAAWRFVHVRHDIIIDR